jgi:endonuclease/exonuclease/phosphatase (EEP) superfamily protein YafD
MDREALASVGGAAFVNAHRIDLGGRDLWLTNMHLETPREGLEMLREGRLGEGSETIRRQSFLRGIELRRAERFTRELEGPRVVLGDFNTPVESRTYEEEWGDWTNAFSKAGQGFGWTRLSGWVRARIDHVLVDDAWTVVDAFPGADVGSDHLPMIARIRLR